MTQQLNPHPDVLLVTGMSGAGRSTVGRVLEDTGWYVADNVPTELIPQVVTVARTGGAERVACVVRENPDEFSGALATIRADLAAEGLTARLVFLDADDDVLVRRFEQVRRRHPLQGNGTLVEGITQERTALGPVQAIADLYLDTSALSSSRLRQIIEGWYAATGDLSLTIAVQSFGFKYGLPSDADMVADVRFVPNPFWIPELKPLTGQDQPVRDFVLSQDGVDTFLRLQADLINLVAQGYLREGKRYLTVAIGCTGGKHRSVAITERLAALLAGASLGAAGVAEFSAGVPTGDGFSVRVVHRDLGRE